MDGKVILFFFFSFFFPFRERCMVALVFFPDTRVFCLFCLLTLNSFLSLGGDLDVFFILKAVVVVVMENHSGGGVFLLLSFSSLFFFFSSTHSCSYSWI